MALKAVQLCSFQCFDSFDCRVWKRRYDSEIKIITGVCKTDFRSMYKLAAGTVEESGAGLTPGEVCVRNYARWG